MEKHQVKLLLRFLDNPFLNFKKIFGEISGKIHPVGTLEIGIEKYSDAIPAGFAWWIHEVVPGYIPATDFLKQLFFQ